MSRRDDDAHGVPRRHRHRRRGATWQREDAALGIPLTRLKTGAKAVVLSLSESSPHERNKLMALGVVPGVTVRLLQRFPTYVIAVGHTQLALDAETARAIRTQVE